LRSLGAPLKADESARSRTRFGEEERQFRREARRELMAPAEATHQLTNLRQGASGGEARVIGGGSCVGGKGFAEG
jgi:hypothetical protein